MAYDSLEHMIAEVFGEMTPPEPISVAEAAKKYVGIKEPGSYVGMWSERLAPYLVEPQEILTSLDYVGMIFLGPARTGKSQMALNWIAHTAKTDPSDMMIVHMTQQTARNWSKKDLDKMFRHSPEIKKLLRVGRQNDNIFDKEFKSGMQLEVTWPTSTNLSGKTIRRNWVLDYDRIDDDIDGEGNAYDLTAKRAETFKRFGMTVAESSPNPDKEIADPKWSPKSPHEGPPITGIFGLYNRGDQRRWYWRCPQCRHSFMPQFKLLDYPKSDDFMESAEQVTLICPHDGFPMEPTMKEELNAGGRWVRNGMVWTPENELVRDNRYPLRRSNIASFWMEGPAAAFQEWKSLVLNYLQAEKAYEDTADEMPLRKTVTTDQGSYYISKARLSDRLPEDLKNKAEDWGATEEDPTVPRGVRFLIATVDVQARAFVVQVQGFTAEGDIVVIDGFKIRKSNRKDADGDLLPLDPAAFAEDWRLLRDKVIRKSYRLDDDTTRRMRVKIVGCDSGGREGVTVNAYKFWRWLKQEGEGDHRRLVLVKGDEGKIPRTAVKMPDNQKKDKDSAARGDVPVLFIDVNVIKDQVQNMLARRTAEVDQGGGMIRFPKWMPEWFYMQLTTEIRTPKGWQNPQRKRNEAWDLLVYAIAVAVRPPDELYFAPWGVIRWERINWDEPPGWAKEWDENDLVFGEEAPMPFAPKKVEKKSFADLAKKLT